MPLTATPYGRKFLLLGLSRLSLIAPFSSSAAAASIGGGSGGGCGCGCCCKAIHLSRSSAAAFAAAAAKHFSNCQYSDTLEKKANRRRKQKPKKNKSSFQKQILQNIFFIGYFFNENY